MDEYHLLQSGNYIKHSPPKNSFSLVNKALRFLKTSPSPHTHTYIFTAFHNAFCSLGYDSIILPSLDSYAFDANYHYLIFIQAHHRVALVDKKNITYLSHNITPDQLSSLGLSGCKARVINQDALQYNRKDEIGEMISDLCYYNSTTDTLTLPWAAPLSLSSQEELVPTSSSFPGSHDHIYYIGMLYGDSYTFARDANDMLAEQNISIINTQFASEAQHNELVSRFPCAFDLRYRDHIRDGYLPCRVFKNLSLGVPVIVNSAPIIDALPLPAIHFASDKSEFCKAIIEFRPSVDDIRLSSQYIKEKHSYLQRCKIILDLL